MTTVFTAKGITFTGFDLPVIAPFVSDGLIGAYRPNNGAQGMEDLSGNGNTPVVAGSPQFTDTALVGDADNGIITPIIETESYTVMVVQKVTDTGAGFGSFPIGNYGADLGFALWNTASVDATSSAMSSVSALRDDTLTGNRMKITGFSGISGRESYIFLAMSVNAATNTVKLYAPIGGYIETSFVANEDRHYAGRFIDDSNPVSIAYQKEQKLSSWGGQVSVSEALIYNKALTDAQVLEQYEYSKEFMAQHRGITI